jgi:predicted dehydrogenase
MTSYRVAILGCRGRGMAAARAYHEHPQTEIVGLCDLVAELRDSMGEELGVDARYEDLDRMIESTDPDIVVIATGTEFHYDLAMRVLEHGVHIDVEKPLCTDLEEADAVIAKARDKEVRIAVHHQGRTGGAMLAVKKAIAEGKIGSLRYLHGSGKGYYGAYGLMNIGTHMLNNMMGIAGHCRSVGAVVLTDGRPVVPGDVLNSAGGMGVVAGEQITASLDFSDGVTGTLVQHRFPKMDTAAYALEIFGTEGRLLWKTTGAWWLPVPHFLPGGEGCEWQPLKMLLPESFSGNGRASEADYWYADDFVRALDEGREHECSGPEGLHVMEIMMGIFESGAYGRYVGLPQAERNHPLLRWLREADMELPGPVPRPYGEWLAAEDERLGRSGS